MRGVWAVVSRHFAVQQEAKVHTMDGFCAAHMCTGLSEKIRVQSINAAAGFRLFGWCLAADPRLSSLAQTINGFRGLGFRV